jgi:hypothetical protein
VVTPILKPHGHAPPPSSNDRKGNLSSRNDTKNPVIGEYLTNGQRQTGDPNPLKRLSHEIFGPVFWAVGMYLGLNMNRLWFLNFNAAPLILDNYSKF